MIRTGRVDFSTKELVILSNDDSTELERYPLGTMVFIQTGSGLEQGCYWMNGREPVVVVQSRGTPGRSRNISYPAEGWLVAYEE